MKHVALLRGINVGGHKKVDMKELKKCFESLGFEKVSTYINSGNVIFEAYNPLEKEIEKAIEDYFGFHVPTLVRSEKQIEHLCEKIPDDWENNTEQKTDIIFLWGEVDSQEVINEIKQNKEVDTLLYLP
jgi:uncharacterized protein (DUF1697 family)